MAHLHVLLHFYEWERGFVGSLFEVQNSWRLEELGFSIGTVGKNLVVSCLLEVGPALVHGAHTLQMIQDLNLTRIKSIHRTEGSRAGARSSTNRGIQIAVALIF